MRKIIVRKIIRNKDELKLFIDEALICAADQFGWDNFIAEGYIEDDTHVIVIQEKEN